MCPLKMLFIDFKSALDTIKRTAIDKKRNSEEYNTNHQKIYEDAELSVLHNRNINQPFYINAGVKQGYPVLPQLQGVFY